MRFREIGIFAAVVSALVLAPAAAAPIRFETEQRLTNDPASSRLTYNFARTIATDESGAVHVVWYDTRGGESQVYYKRSPDGGEAFEPDLRLSSSAGSEHPSIAVSGRSVFVVWHASRNGKFNVFLEHSEDGGSTWSGEAALTTAGTCAHASVAASAPRIHVVWGDTRSGTAEMYTRRSTDLAATWEPERRLTEEPYESWVPTVAVSGDLVLAAWVDLRDGNEEEYVKRSTDGGATWEPDRRLTENEADSWASSVGISGETVHFVWFDRRDAGVSHTDIERTIDEAMVLVGLPAEPAPPRDPHVYYLAGFGERIAGKLRRVLAAAPAWVAAGGDLARLDALLKELEKRFEAWAGGWEIYYKRSEDSGAAWSPDMRLTKSPEASARPSIAVRGDDLYVVWFDARDRGGRTDPSSEIYFKHSSDGGRTWSADRRLTNTAGISEHAAVAVSSEAVHVVWHDDRDGNFDLYYARGSGPSRPGTRVIGTRPIR